MGRHATYMDYFSYVVFSVLFFPFLFFSFLFFSFLFFSSCFLFILFSIHERSFAKHESMKLIMGSSACHRACVGIHQGSNMCLASCFYLCL